VTTALCLLGEPLTVGGLLDLANIALGGGDTKGASIADINQAVDAINEGFDECRFLLNPNCTANTGSCVSASLLGPSSDSSLLAGMQSAVEAAPSAWRLNRFGATLDTRPLPDPGRDPLDGEVNSVHQVFGRLFLKPAMRFSWAPVRI